MVLKPILVDTCVCLAVVSFLVGCSSSSSSDPAPTVLDGSTEFDGSYNEIVTSTGENANIDYSCESGLVGLYGDCSGATFDHDTRTVTFSNVQLQAPGFGTVITLNGSLTY